MRKERQSVAREIDEHWTAEQLFKLKSLADSMLDDFYPGVISPLVETDDIVGSYLSNPVPYTVTATQPYVAWCMHKYPPYDLKVDESLTKMELIPFFGNKQSTQQLSVVTPSLAGNLPVNLLNSIEASFNYTSKLNKRERKNPTKRRIEKLQHILNFFQTGHYVAVHGKFHKQYEQKTSGCISKRAERLTSCIDKLSQNELVEHFEKHTPFNDVYDTFFKNFPAMSSKDLSIGASVIKYRLLAHIIIMFLKVAGYERDIDYTPDRIKEYRGKSKDDKNSMFSSIRSTLETLPINTTLPDKDTLDSIQKHARKLLEQLHGRTQDYDLLFQLEKLMHANSNDFCIAGRISAKKSVAVRAFIKSVATFLCIYHFDYLMGYLVIMEKPEFDNEFAKFSDATTDLVQLVTEMFFYNVGAVYVKNNVKEIYSEVHKILEQNLIGHRLHIPDHSDDMRTLKQAHEVMQRAIHMDTTLLNKIEDNNDPDSDIDVQKYQCRAAIRNAKGGGFWCDTFSYFGQVNIFKGTVELTKLELPLKTFEQDDNPLNLAIYVLEKRIEALLDGCKPLL